MSGLADLFAPGPAPAPTSGNTPWAAGYAGFLRSAIEGHAARAPRNVQRHLGPSELGVSCDRQAAGKMAGIPAVNHIADPWPSIVGVAVHGWLEDMLKAWNVTNGARFLAEQRVTPHPNHPGTADGYDALERAVIDWKCLGETSLNKVRQAPPRKYVVQMHLYGLGYQRMGLPVDRVVLVALPRTKASLADMYVWEAAQGADAYALLVEVFADTARRAEYARELVAGTRRFTDIPMVSDDSECYFCPFYRSSSRDGEFGCPGTVNH